MDNDDQSNIFSPSEAHVEDYIHNVEPPFYVVSLSKFWILFISTLGLYTLYWFYSNWRLYGNHRKIEIKGVWLLLRAIFHIFVTHSLFKKMDTALQEGRHQHKWMALTTATSFVMASILSSVLTSIGIKEFYMAGIALSMISGYFLSQAQVVANIVSKDTKGAANKRITAANIGWIIFGLLMWVSMLSGVYLPR